VDTAALLGGLDLVITSDTSIAHLAGALGRPVWVALNASPDWRWLRDRTDSPWYPTMRLFRQSDLNRSGGWDAVIADLVAALTPLAARR
jgi:ADP-heptose:LPS heptosyltransferase